MKTSKKSKISDLSVDVVEYMFVEWLVRQGLLSAYKANCEKFHPNYRSFRDNLRARLRYLRRSSYPSIESLILTSFPFSMTPEGYNFWSQQSTLWRRFCSSFKSTF